MATYFLTWPPKPPAPPPLRGNLLNAEPGCTEEEANEAILQACEMFNISKSDAIRHWRLRLPSTEPESSDHDVQQDAQTSTSPDPACGSRSDSPGSSEPGTATARTTKLRVIVSYERKIPNDAQQQLQPDPDICELPMQPKPQPPSLEGQLQYRQQSQQQQQLGHPEQSQPQPITQHRPDSQSQRQQRASSERDSRPSTGSDPRVNPHPHHWPGHWPR